MSDNNNDFLPLRRNYEDLKVFKIARCIHAITHYFSVTYIYNGDRTRDQMEQGARSGKQNIAEGSVDGATSVEMELRLMNVARGSMQELKTDYEDYLLHRGLEQWAKDDPRTRQVRQFTKNHNDPREYLEKVKERSPETIANIALTMIHQYDYMMVRLIESIKRRFLQEGGIKEQLLRARLKARDQQQNPGDSRSARSARSAQSSRSSQSSQSDASYPSDPSSPSDPSDPSHPS